MISLRGRNVLSGSRGGSLGVEELVLEAAVDADVGADNLSRWSWAWIESSKAIGVYVRQLVLTKVFTDRHCGYRILEQGANSAVDAPTIIYPNRPRPLISSEERSESPFQPRLHHTACSRRRR